MPRHTCSLRLAFPAAALCMQVAAKYLHLLTLERMRRQVRNSGPGWLPADRGPLLAYPPWLAGEWRVSRVRL